MNKPLKKIPKFASEAEERAFWEANDSADYIDWTKAKRAVLRNLKLTTKTILTGMRSTLARVTMRQ